MKKRVFTTFIGLMFIAHSFSQSWTTQTSGTSNDIWGISFVDPINGWASGSVGTILNTTDGGANWAPQTSGVSTPILRTINMFNASTGWTVGDNGTILHTTNGGVNWNPQTSGVVVTLRQSTFVTSNIGWVCGASGTILHTTDGGTNWTPQTSGTTIGLMSIHFVDANNGWAVGTSGAVTQGIILHTSDGGVNWAPQTAPNTTNLNACSFSNTTIGWAAGNGGTIFNTTDGGTNWTLQTNPSSNAIRGMCSVSGTDAWVAGDAGSVVHTTDGGANWNTQTTGSSQILRSTYFINANRGYAVGQQGTILFYNQPIITASSSMISFNTLVGMPSTPQSFTISGMNLTASIDITAPADFEVSLSYASGYGAMVSIPPTNTVVGTTTIYVRYNPSTGGAHSGNITAASTGAATQNIAVDGTSTYAGIENNEQITISIFPNPASDYVQIQSNNNTIRNIEFCDLTGKMLLQLKDLNTSQYSLSISSLPNGIYMVTIFTDNGAKTKKVLIN